MSKYSKEEFIEAYNISSSKAEVLTRIGLSKDSYGVFNKRCKEYDLDSNKFSNKISYTKEEFIKAYNTSKTKTELLEKIGLSPKSLKSLKKRCEEYQLDINKFQIKKRFLISDKKFKEAVKKATSYRNLLIILGYAPQGGNYAVVKNRCSELNLNVSHFTGSAWNKEKSTGPKRDINDYLTNKFQIGSNKLKNRLLKEGFFDYKCYKCGRKKWNNIPISLELEHIDGNHFNNNLSNLTLLCPNCHAQTDTYRGKNKGFYS